MLSTLLQGFFEGPRIEKFEKAAELVLILKPLGFLKC